VDVGSTQSVRHPTKSLPTHEGTQLLWLIGHSYRLSRRRTELIVRAHGVTMAQLSLLMTLADEPRLSGIDVADRALITPQAAHAALSALERKGLVHRVAEAEHRRVVRSVLSENGAKVVTTCLDELRDLGIDLGARLPARKRRQLIALMTEYVEATGRDDE
jgi:DNA-binding MarR family transcriptional regulator